MFLCTYALIKCLVGGGESGKIVAFRDGGVLAGWPSRKVGQGGTGPAAGLFEKFKEIFR